MPALQELLHQGRYRLVQPFSNGSENVAYNAYDTVGNVNVLVKEIHGTSGEVFTPTQRETLNEIFAEQARILKGLRHENILNVEDFFLDVDRQFLVLESVSAIRLRDFLSDHQGPLDPALSGKWTAQLLNAVQFLSERTTGFVNGRITPSNIYVSADGNLKLAAISVFDGQAISVDTSIQTDAGEESELCYSPLEIIWESLDPASQKVISSSYDDKSAAILLEAPDIRSDVYSIGSIIYRMVTGVAPIDALERSIEVLDGNPDPLLAPSSMVEGIPDDLSNSILRSVSIRREDRFDTASEMLSSLAKTVKGSHADAARVAQGKTAALQIEEAEAKKKAEAERLLEAKRREFEEEKARQERIRRERIAEIEKRNAILQEARAVKAEPVTHTTASVEDDLLGIENEDVKYTSETSASPSKEPLIDLRPAKTEPFSSASAETPEIEVIGKADQPVLGKPEAESSAAIEDIAVAETTPRFEIEDDVPMFAAQPQSFPMAAIVGGIAVLIVAVIGVWMFALRDSGGTSVPVQSTVPVSSVSDPASVAVDPSSNAEVAVEPSPSESPSSAFADQPELVPDESGTTKAAAAAPERKKTPIPAKTVAKPEPAKKVTVDDLINDN